MYTHVSPPRHAGTRVGPRGSAWVRVTMPRGLACHVASTWVSRKNNPPFYYFLIVLNDLNSKINSEKSIKSLKIRKIITFKI